MILSHWVNLSAGAEWVPELDLHGVPHGLMRIQSTWCEQKRWCWIVEDAEVGFLVALAALEEVHVYDMGARKHLSRALWQGVPWLKFALHYRRYGAGALSVDWRGNDATKYCVEQVRKLTPRAKRKLDYAGAFSGSGNLARVVNHCRSFVGESSADRAAHLIL